MSEQHCYRVWMQDGYCSLVCALSIDEARAFAVALALEATKGLAMSAADRRKACAVDYAEDLSNES